MALSNIIAGFIERNVQDLIAIFCEHEKEVSTSSLGDMIEGTGLLLIEYNNDDDNINAEMLVNYLPFNVLKFETNNNNILDDTLEKLIKNKQQNKNLLYILTSYDNEDFLVELDMNKEIQNLRTLDTPTTDDDDD